MALFELRSYSCIPVPNRHSKALLFSILLLIFLRFSSFEAQSQITGDYRSNAIGTGWGTAANWDRFNGATWVAGVSYPGQAAPIAGTTVTILDTHTRILDVSPANSIVNLVVGGGVSGIMSIGINANNSFTLTCTGAVTVSAGGTLQSAGNTGGTHTLNFQSTLVNNGTINGIKNLQSQWE